MRRTRLSMLVALFVVAASIGWGLSVIIDAWIGRVVPVPWLAAATMWILALALALWALMSRPRLLRKPGVRPLPPLVAARTAALAMSASRAGVLVAGIYAGVAIGAFPMRDTPAGSSTMWAALITALGSIAVAAVALWLERMCLIKSERDPNEPRGTGSNGMETGGAHLRVGSGT